jgi:hydrogenase maturation protein HypF
MACAWLAAIAGDDEPVLPRALEAHVDRRIWGQIARLSGSPVSPLTSSMGRLFDAVAALCGICPRVSYEGQAAIELEAACDPGERGSYEIALVDRDGLVVFDPRPAIAAVVADVAAGTPLAKIASRFHAAVARMTVSACARVASRAGTELLVLSGGVFQNRRLLEATARGIERAGLRVLVPERLPANDGGISYGQAAIAAARIAGE